VALNFLHQGGEVNDVSSLYFLGNLYKLGNPSVSQNLEKSTSYYRRAADKGHSLAAYAAAIALSEGIGCERSPKEALEYMHLASDGGHHPATLALAREYASGSLGKQDKPSAKIFYQLLLADKKCPEAVVDSAREELKTL